MLTPSEEGFVLTHAYVPEHVPGYVTAISGTEPHLLENYLCYHGQSSLVFVGFPLGSPFDPAAMREALDGALSRFAPGSVALTAPTLSMPASVCQASESDRYWRLDLSGPRIHGKLQSLIRRAARELSVERVGKMEEEHAGLIADFLGLRRVSEETRHIFEGIPRYVASAPTARVFEARDGGGNLVAFDVAEFGARDYAFYQFNLRSRTRYVPGASDLLLHEVIQTAREEDKRFVNLGLGINEGVASFKRKWGAVPFLGYEFCRFRPRRPSLFDALLRRL